MLAHEGVYFSCPLCPVTALQSEIDAHLSDCLHKVPTCTCMENSYRHPNVWFECPHYHPSVWAECPYDHLSVWAVCPYCQPSVWAECPNMSVINSCIYYGVVCKDMSVLYMYVN